MNSYKYLTVAALALLLLASCGSSGIGDILNGGGSGNQNVQLRGTVDSVDLNSQSIYLTNVSNYNGSMLSSGNAVRVYFDNSTTVNFQGQSYRPQDLERGDQVDVNGAQSNNKIVANSMTVISNVRTGSGSSYPTNTYPNNGTYGSTIHGTVTYVDTSRQTVQIDTGTGNVQTISFNSSTPVYFNGQTYRMTDLERGDEVNIRTTSSNYGLTAQDVTVIRSVSSGGSTGGYGTSTQTSTVRGTVQYVDATNRTIQLTSTTRVSGFNPGTRSTTSTMVIHYDPGVQVDVRGTLYPVSGLERGDIIEVQVQNLGSSNVLAQHIFLIQDVNNRM